MKTNTLKSVAFMTVLALAGSWAAYAERADDAERKSKNGMTQGSIGGTEVTIEYGRPQVKEREIWGALVPFDKLWRTGADEATTIHFSSDVTVNGKPLAAGTYALFTVPGKERWAFVFNKAAEQWGSYDHDAAQDAVRIEAMPNMGDHVEELDFRIDGSVVSMHWEKLSVGFEVAPAG